MKENNFSLEGKTVLVTGASSGIGKTIAQVCSVCGAKLIINGRNEERLQETYSLIGGEPHQQVVADLTDYERIAAIVKELPTIEGLVLCAGIGQTLPVQNVKADKTEQVFKTNSIAPITLIQNLIKSKKINNGGSIILISSVASRKPYYGNAVYSASKAAVNGYTRVAAMELAKRNIRVNCIEPGLIMTDIVTEAGFDEVQLAEFKRNMPLGFGSPKDVASGCVYLLSDAARWVTGTSLIIDGGQNLI